MNEERQRVLRMLKEGKVSVEEAEALLEALEEAAPEPGAGQQPPRDAPPEPAGEACPRAADAEEARAEARGEFQRLLDDIIRAVDVDSIRDTVRESLRRSKVDVGRVKEEVRRATERVREETRRAAREYRHGGWGYRISRTIEGLWGLTPAVGSWAHEADLEPGRTLSMYNIWGDVRLRASPDGRLRVAAVRRAWGRDDEEARYVLEAVTVTATDQGDRISVRVHPPAGEFYRRFRADFDVQVPNGVAVEVEQARGDVAAAGLGAALVVRAASGDVAVREHGGAAQIELTKGDVSVHHAAGDVRVTSKHGDVALAGIGGGATVHLMHGDIKVSGVGGAVDLQTMHGDVEVEAVAGRVAASSKHGDLRLRRPAGPVSFDLETARGDIHVEVGQFQPGSASRMRTMIGDLAARLGEEARCRISARVTSGEIRTGVALTDQRADRRSLDGVFGAADASLDLTTISGDIAIEGLERAATAAPQVGTHPA